jgi:hypothetical protein
MKIRELRDLLAFLPGDWDVMFSSDEELNILYSRAEIAQLQGEQRYVLFPFGKPEPEA